MPTIGTPLVDFSDAGNTRTYAAPSHNVRKPSLVQQRRRVPASLEASAETSVKVIQGTQDEAGKALASKYSFEVVARGPVNGLAADQTAALALFREIVASEEFAAAVQKQVWLKG